MNCRLHLFFLSVLTILLSATTQGEVRWKASEIFAEAITNNKVILIGKDREINEDQIEWLMSNLTQDERAALNLSKIDSLRTLDGSPLEQDSMLVSLVREPRQRIIIHREFVGSKEREISSPALLVGDEYDFVFVPDASIHASEPLISKLLSPDSPFSSEPIYGVYKGTLGLKVTNLMGPNDTRAVLHPDELADLKKIVTIFKKFKNITKEQASSLLTIFGKNLAKKLVPNPLDTCGTCKTDCEICACDFNLQCSSKETFANCPYDCPPPSCPPCQEKIGDSCVALTCQNGATCKVANGQSLCEYCGNKVIEAGEDCDDGNTNNLDTCTNSCKIARCGDGIKAATEQCDDGNRINQDACTNTCKIASCGDGIKRSTEQCDDGNRNNQDACTNLCKIARCGDGIKRSTEQCDDGNSINTDRCTNTCRIRP